MEESLIRLALKCDFDMSVAIFEAVVSVCIKRLKSAKDKLCHGKRYSGSARLLAWTGSRESWHLARCSLNRGLLDVLAFDVAGLAGSN
jgi:hypothetical protein